MKEQNITIGKIILSVIAIGVLFIPALAVQQIESRTFTHIMEVEGNYVDGDSFEFGETFDADDIDAIDFGWKPDETYGNETTADSAYYGRKSGTGTNEVIWYGERMTYLGNGSYNVAINQSELPDDIWTLSRVMIMKTNLTLGDFLNYDFIRATVTEDMTEPKFINYNTFQPVEGISSPVKISDTEYLWVLSMYDKSACAATPDTQVWLTFGSYWVDVFPEDATEFEFRIQGEVLSGADVLSWDDETLYVMAVMLCDGLLIGAIVFASDPIDIIIDRGSRKRK